MLGHCTCVSVAVGSKEIGASLKRDKHECPTGQSSRLAALAADFRVSAVLRTALTAELSVPCGSARPFCFSQKDAKPRRALTRTALTNRSSGSPLHSDSALRVGVCVTWTPLNSAVKPL